MSKCLVTYAHGPHEELLEISLPRFREYAALHGYDVRVGGKATDLPPAWNKVALLREMLAQGCGEVLWLDADLVVARTDVDVAAAVEARDEAVGKKHAFALVRHFTAQSEVPNTGVWYCRPAALPLLEECLKLEVFAEHGWWEQAALMTLMGYIVPPQGSDFDRTKCYCVKETRWTRECAFLRVEWNSHPNYRAKRPRVVHCTYPDMLTRIETMRRLVDEPDYEYPEWVREKK